MGLFFGTVKRLLAYLLLPTLLAASADGQIVTFTFDGDVNSAASGTTGIVASDVASNDNSFSFFNGASGDAISENGWDVGLGLQYFDFTFTVSSGYTVSITSMDFNHRRGGTGPPDTFEIRTSTDGFSGGWNDGTVQTIDNSAIKTTSGFSAIGERSITFTGLTDLTAGTAVSVRIGASGATGSSATLLLDDVSVYGTVSAVPEPSSFAALLGLSAVGIVATRRRGRKPSAVARA